MNIFLTIIVGLLSVFFLFAGSIKVFGWQKKIFEIQLAFMKKYGLNRQILGLIGGLEIASALAICFGASILKPLGLLAIFFTSIGALYFHFRYDEWKDAIPAIITALLSATVLVAEKSYFISLFS